MCVLKDNIVETMGPDALQYLTFQKFIIVYILFTTFISIGQSLKTSSRTYYMVLLCQNLPKV